ncbi:hypothetical protein LINPERPRIM_LOCUS16069, partial [Linum perenne]
IKWAWELRGRERGLQVIFHGREKKRGISSREREKKGNWLRPIDRRKRKRGKERWTGSGDETKRGRTTEMSREISLLIIVESRLTLINRKKNNRFNLSHRKKDGILAGESPSRAPGLLPRPRPHPHQPIPSARQPPHLPRPPRHFLHQPNHRPQNENSLQQNRHSVRLLR